MSEYWVSQGRKMCTYCKCWIADNKASINFHEQGKNHKENVKKKLDELRKKGVAEAKKKQTEQSDLEKIEKAALASLKKDITCNPTMASAYGITEDKFEEVHKAALAYKPADAMKSSNNSNISRVQRGNKDVKSTTSSTYSNASEIHDTSADSTVHYMGDWYTAVNNEGYTYYWNTVTNETSWYPPDSQPTNAEGSMTNESSQTSTTTTSTTESTVPEADKQPLESSESKQPTPTAARTPANPSPYGQWQVIRKQETPNLQLPHDISNYQVSMDDIPLPESSSAADTETADSSSDPTESDAPKRKFKEKELSLGSTSSNQLVTFKKRKFGANRQSRRQAADDD